MMEHKHDIFKRLLWYLNEFFKYFKEISNIPLGWYVLYVGGKGYAISAIF